MLTCQPVLPAVMTRSGRDVGEPDASADEAGVSLAGAQQKTLQSQARIGVPLRRAHM